MTNSMKVEERVEIDMDRIFGNTIDGVIEYLQELREKHPRRALFKDDTPYERVSIQLVWERDETPGEIEERERRERLHREMQERIDADRAAREERYRQYMKLKREFG